MSRHYLPDGGIVFVGRTVVGAFDAGLIAHGNRLAGARKVSNLAPVFEDDVVAEGEEHATITAYLHVIEHHIVYLHLGTSVEVYRAVVLPVGLTCHTIGRDVLEEDVAEFGGLLFDASCGVVGRVLQVAVIPAGDLDGRRTARHGGISADDVLNRPIGACLVVAASSGIGLQAEARTGIGEGDVFVDDIVQTLCETAHRHTMAIATGYVPGVHMVGFRVAHYVVVAGRDIAVVDVHIGTPYRNAVGIVRWVGCLRRWRLDGHVVYGHVAGASALAEGEVGAGRVEQLEVAEQMSRSLLDADERGTCA